MNKKKILIAAAVIALIVAVIAAIAILGGKEKKEDAPPVDMPENIIDFNNKTGEDLIPVTETEEHGNVAEATAEDIALPTEEELGEYQEIFMEGDELGENTRGGWVVAVSLDDITINTYNVLTTYTLAEAAKSTAARLKPGDAVIVDFNVYDDGTAEAYGLGRVRVEDEPLTKDEIEQMQKEAEANGQ